MLPKSDAILKGKLTRGLKKEKEFSCELPKSEKVCLLFDGILLSIAS